MIMIIKVASIQQSSFKTCRCFDYSVVVFFSEGTGSEEPKAIVKVNFILHIQHAQSLVTTRRISIALMSGDC